MKENERKSNLGMMYLQVFRQTNLIPYKDYWIQILLIKLASCNVNKWNLKVKKWKLKLWMNLAM